MRPGKLIIRAKHRSAAPRPVPRAAPVKIHEIAAECGLVEAGFASFTEWKPLISRRAGCLHYDQHQRANCMITVPAPWRDTPGPSWQLVAAMLRNQRRELLPNCFPRCDSTCTVCGHTAAISYKS